MTRIYNTNPDLRVRETTPSEYRFVCDLTGVPVSEFDLWITEGYDSVSDTLMLVQEFDGLTDAQMVRSANLCDYEGVSINQAIAEVLGC
jgi:hypothetical protein